MPNSSVLCRNLWDEYYTYNAITMSHMDEDADVPLLDDEDQGVQRLRSVTSAQLQAAKWPQFIASAVAVIGGVVAGFILGFSSPTIPQLEAHEPPILTQYQATWYSSLITLGAACGGPIAAPLSDKLGRKATIMSTSLPAVVGWAIISSSEDYYWLK